MTQIVYGLGNVFKNTHYCSSARSAGGHHSHGLSVHLKESDFVDLIVYLKIQCSCAVEFSFRQHIALGF